MSITEQALKERIKELTCLYEVSSIIGNANSDLIEETLKAIAFSLKNAFQYPEVTVVTFCVDDISISTDLQVNNALKIQSHIKIFNKDKGE